MSLPVSRSVSAPVSPIRMVASMSMQPIHPRSSNPFAVGLSADWDPVVASSAARRALRRWRLPSLAAGCRDPDELVVVAGHGRPLDDDEGDRVLHALVALAADDDLAACVVLQRVLPALISVATRRAGANRRGKQLALEELTAVGLDRHPHLSGRSSPEPRRLQHRSRQ